MPFCGKCGQSVNEDNAFCTQCGAQLDYGSRQLSAGLDEASPAKLPSESETKVCHAGHLNDSAVDRCSQCGTTGFFPPESASAMRSSNHESFDAGTGGAVKHHGARNFFIVLAIIVIAVILVIVLVNANKHESQAYIAGWNAVASSTPDPHAGEYVLAENCNSAYFDDTMQGGAPAESWNSDWVAGCQAANNTWQKAVAANGPDATIASK